jgi:hypothetical protein
MRRLDDYVHVEPFTPRRQTLFPRVGVARTAGVAEALASSNQAETSWAVERLGYYESLRHEIRECESFPSLCHGLDAPRQLSLLAEIRHRSPLLEKAAEVFNDCVEMGNHDSFEARVGIRRRGPLARCAGTIDLLAMLGRDPNTNVISFLETARDVDGLMEVGSAEGRRVLARIARQDGHDRFGAANRLVNSLKENAIAEEEQQVARKELLDLLESGAAAGDTRAGAMALLRTYTGRDFGDDWNAWRAVLGGKDGCTCIQSAGAAMPVAGILAALVMQMARRRRTVRPTRAPN